MVNSQKQSSYRQILKATGLFGGVQVIIIIVNILRTKFIAVFLGTRGVGIISLLNTPLGLISSITGLGISYSAIRDISESAGTGDQKKIARSVISFRRLVVLTGILGMVSTIFLAPLLSKWTFGNSNYTWAFIFLSATLLINAISGGQKAILQGLRKLKSMAKSTVIGSIAGLFISIPLYYIYGIQGIVPSIIISAFVALILSWYYARQVTVERIDISYMETIYEGKELIKLGILLSISTQFGGLVKYVIVSYISKTGGIDQVGLYTAGISFIATYIGLVFSAMGTDYYPKLAAISKDNKEVMNMVNQQAIISLLIIFPIVILLLIFMPFAINIFLTSKFSTIIPFVNLTALGVLFQAVSFSIGYISFAKGDSKFFFWMEGVFSNILNLSLCILGYKFFGLIGIGIAYLLLYMIYLVVLYVLIHKRYKFSFDKQLYVILSIAIIISLMAYISIQFISSYLLYIVLMVLLLFSIIYSFKELDNRIDIKNLIVNYKNKNLNKSQISNY